MRKTLLPAAVLLAATSAFAQSLTEKIDVALVNVDVTVTSHGAPTRGLTRDNFEVLEDGVARPITHFYAIENAREKTTPAAAPASSVAAAGTSQPDETDERFRRRVLVIIDNRHMSFHYRDVALRKLEQFINDHFSSGSYDWSIAMIGERAHLLLPLTSDKTRIHDTLAEIHSVVAGRTIRDMYHLENRIAPIIPEAVVGASMGPSSGGEGALNALIEQSNRFQYAADAATTYQSIREVARSFANAPGRKIILLLTGVFSEEENALSALDPTLATRQQAAIEEIRNQLIREANASNVSVNVINVEGLMPNNVGADSHGSTGSDSMRPGSSGGASAGGMFWIARQTGGQSFTGNFVDRSLRDFDVTSSNFYSLAYRPDHGEDRKYHSITVRLKKPGRYSLTYRNGYSSLPVELQLERAMTSTMSVEMQPSTIPVGLTTGTGAAADVAGAVVVPIYTAVPAKQLQFIPTGDKSVARVDFFVSIFGESGRLIRTFRTVREAQAKPGSEGEGNFVETRSVRLRKGVPYRLVVAVHDQVTDAIGITSKTVRF